MSLKYGKALVGAFAAVTVSTFTVPFAATAMASTGTTVSRVATPAMQLAQVEQQETEEKTEQKTKEVQGGVEVAPPVVAAPVVPGAVEQKHEESKTTETVNSNNGMGGTSEREHEEHQTSKTVEQNP